MMLGLPNKPQPARAVAARAGMRRVDWVRVQVGEHGQRAHAMGSSHRLPRVVPISMELATELGLAGVPLVMRCMDEHPAGKALH